jgi:imidazolonepropionase-like amidohydrolase
MKGMIDRGFTTVRDTGGADWGIKTAVESGLIPARGSSSPAAPSARPAATAIRAAAPTRARPCGCCNAMVYCMAIADGPDEVRKLVREQMRQGADQVKIMCSGGVASPYDPLDSLQFSEPRSPPRPTRPRNFGRYVLAHAYSPGGDHPGDEQRRAHHRARQPDRRQVGPADQVQGRLHGSPTW